MRRRWWRRSEITLADFGTDNSPFPSLVALTSLPVGWPQFRGTTRANFPRLVEFVIRFSQGAAAGVEQRIADVGQELTLDGRLASGGGARNRAVWIVCVGLHETLCPSNLRFAQKLQANQARR